jgi:hypothetical protein
MKIWKKLVITAALIVTVMLIFPMLIVRFSSPHDFMGLLIILFFMVCPLTFIVIGIMSGTAIKKLWWLPIISPLAFPVVFGVSIEELVVDFFIYSAMYICAGVVAMLGTHFGIVAFRKRRSAHGERE